MLIVDFIKYKWKYSLSVFLANFVFAKCSNNNYLFVVHSQSRNWILGSKARRLQTNSNLPGGVVYSDNFIKLPDAEGYFFLHQKYFARSIRYNPHLQKRKLIVMYTHSEWNQWYNPSHIAYILNFAHYIVCLNSGVKKELIAMNIPIEKIIMLHLASDPEMFQPKIRSGNGSVGFSMAFGPRKNPEMVANIVKNMPHRNFILIGPNWQQFLEEKGIDKLPNFQYYSDIKYEKYPELYHQMDVLVSPSNLEGGPVPILEAMLCNVVPVASRTGYCPDLIEHGQNGFLFDIDASVHDIIKLIENAFLLKENVRNGIEIHSWQNYGATIGKLFTSIK